MHVSVGLLTVAGDKVVDLADPRFKRENAEKGLWRPFDFVFDVGAGIYFLGEYNEDKIPVLFVHGVGGTPLDFQYLVEHLDQDRFQPWVYYYPSGARLKNIAQHLSQLVVRLRAQHKFDRLFVVAHSMGGLVSRAFILQHYDDTSKEYIPLFVSISTPWAGHKAAESGVKHAPAVVRSWYDVAPNSAFLKEIFYTDAETREHPRPLPEHAAQHLLFGFKRDTMLPGVSGDGVITLASQLRPEAQEDADHIYGFDHTHTGILQSPEVSELLNVILDRASR